MSDSNLPKDYNALLRKYKIYHHLKEECFKCWTFLKENENGYDCAYKGACPGLDVSEKNKRNINKIKDKYIEAIKERDDRIKGDSVNEGINFRNRTR